MTIRIFVGCSANGEDAEAQAMLEYTLRRFASEPIELHWMMLSNHPASPWYSDARKGAGWNTRGWATPFSAFRWAVPHVCGFAGKAIYMDVDMIARDDIAKLWNQPHPAQACLLTKDERHSCVMLFDCARIKDKLPDLLQLQRIDGLYRQVRNNLAGLTARFKGNWNCLDGENYPTLADPDIKVIHFTKVETQPHLKFALPRLAAQKQRHWNGLMAAQPHARRDVQPLVDQLWKLAQHAGFTAEKYQPAQPFGQYDSVRGGARAA